MKKYLFNTTIIIIEVLFISGCSQFLEPKPQDNEINITKQNEPFKKIICMQDYTQCRLSFIERKNSCLQKYSTIEDRVIRNASVNNCIKERYPNEDEECYLRAPQECKKYISSHSSTS